MTTRTGGGEDGGQISPAISSRGDRGHGVAMVGSEWDCRDNEILMDIWGSCRGMAVLGEVGEGRRRKDLSSASSGSGRLEEKVMSTGSGRLEEDEGDVCQRCRRAIR